MAGPDDPQPVVDPAHAVHEVDLGRRMASVPAGSRPSPASRPADRPWPPAPRRPPAGADASYSADHGSSRRVQAVVAHPGESTPLMGGGGSDRLTAPRICRIASSMVGRTGSALAARESAGMADAAAGPMWPSALADHCRTSPSGSRSALTSAGTASAAAGPMLSSAMAACEPQLRIGIGQHLGQRGHGLPALRTQPPERGGRDLPQARVAAVEHLDEAGHGGLAHADEREVRFAAHGRVLALQAGHQVGHVGTLRLALAGPSGEDQRKQREREPAHGPPPAKDESVLLRPLQAGGVRCGLPCNRPATRPRHACVPPCGSSGTTSCCSWPRSRWCRSSGVWCWAGPRARASPATTPWRRSSRSWRSWWRRAATGRASVYRPELLGGMKVRDAIGPLPVVAWLAALGLRRDGGLEPRRVRRAGAARVPRRARRDGSGDAPGGRRRRTRLDAAGVRPRRCRVRARARLAARLRPPHAGRRHAALHGRARAGRRPARRGHDRARADRGGGAGRLSTACCSPATSWSSTAPCSAGRSSLGLWATLGRRPRALALPGAVVAGALLLALPEFWGVLRHALGSDSLRALRGMHITYGFLTAAPGRLAGVAPLDARGDPAPARRELHHHEVNKPARSAARAAAALVPWRKARPLRLGRARERAPRARCSA